MWVPVWVVGKSDFNENSVVSLDLDLDFGLRLRVCQNIYYSCKIMLDPLSSITIFSNYSSLNIIFCFNAKNEIHSIYEKLWP